MSRLWRSRRYDAPARPRAHARPAARPAVGNQGNPTGAAGRRTDGGAGPRGRTGRRRITTELSGGANRAATDRAVSDLALISVRLGTGTAASCHSCVRALQCSVVEAVSAAESSAVDDQLVRNDIATTRAATEQPQLAIFARFSSAARLERGR